MGLGKTLQTIAMLNLVSENGPALVVVPKSLLINWKREINKFAPRLNPYVYNTEGRDKLLSKLKSHDVLLVSYGLAVSDCDLLRRIPLEYSCFG